MTPKQAYQMGFRHIADLAEINRIAEMFEGNESNEYAICLIEAWRQGAIAATALLERQHATVH